MFVSMPIRLPTTAVALIRDIARREDRSMASFARRLVLEALERERKMEQRA